MRIWISLLMILLAVPAWADPESQKKLQRLEKQLSLSAEQKSKLEAQEVQLNQELSALRQKLIAATTAADKSSAALLELENNLNDLEGAAARRSEQLITQRESLAHTLALLQRMAITPTNLYLFSSQPLLNRLHTDVQLRALLPEIQRRADELAASVTDLRELRRKLEAQKKSVVSERASYARKAQDLQKLVEQRNARLKETRAATTALTERLDRLGRDAKDLHDLVERLESEPEETSRTKTVNLPAGALRRLPLSAPATIRFGEKDNFGTLSNGITLRPRAGAPVAAVASGRVAFAGPFRGYGRILILKHNGDFHSVVAGLAKVSVEVGDRVAAGELLGHMPESAAVPPELYFEVRHNGTPVDPLGAVAQRLTKG